MSGCQEALLLTRQATPAVPLQEVSSRLDVFVVPQALVFFYRFRSSVDVETLI